ncbi:proline-rich protein 36-like [Grus americana]|uniref:proline-rich protein 36-like n=1 Tax=Grus americana TaxID=9117 RepID=UPI002407FB4C|nr:proline-rich protein 36-like [Grus americana]XP_054665944.1 proline-rich protein 36-like [Grus americana]
MLSEITKSVKFPVPLFSLSHSLVLRHVAFFEAVEATSGAMGCQNQVLLPVAGFAYLRRLCVPVCVSLCVPQSLSSLLCSALFRCVCPVPCPTFILPSFFLAFFSVLLSCSPTLFLAPSDRPFPGTFVSLLLAPVFLSPLPSPRLPLLSLCPSVLLPAPLFLTLPQRPAPRSSFPLLRSPSPCSPARFSLAPASFFYSLLLCPAPRAAVPRRTSRSGSLPLFSFPPSPWRCPPRVVSASLSRSPSLFVGRRPAASLPAASSSLSVRLPVPVLHSPSLSLPRAFSLAAAPPPPSSWLPLFSSLLASCSWLLGFGGSLHIAAQLSSSLTDRPCVCSTPDWRAWLWVGQPRCPRAGPRAPVRSLSRDRLCV